MTTPSIAHAVAQAVAHSELSEVLMEKVDSNAPADLLLGAHTHAILAEAWARLASAMVVNAASMNQVLDAQAEGGRRSHG